MILTILIVLKGKLDDNCRNCWCNGRHDWRFKRHSWWKFSCFILSYMIFVSVRPNIRYNMIYTKPFQILNWQIYIILCSFLCNGRHVLTIKKIFFILELLFHCFFLMFIISSTPKNYIDLKPNKFNPQIGIKWHKLEELLPFSWIYSKTCRPLHIAFFEKFKKTRWKLS